MSSNVVLFKTKKDKAQEDIGQTLQRLQESYDRGDIVSLTYAWSDKTGAVTFNSSMGTMMRDYAYQLACLQADLVELSNRNAE